MIGVKHEQKRKKAYNRHHIFTDVCLNCHLSVPRYLYVHEFIKNQSRIFAQPIFTALFILSGKLPAYHFGL
jgi:hypothetical protein